MKLDSIWLQDFKNLKDFSVDFDEAGSGLVTVVLGKNGSGKSNLLEALVVIFRDLYLGRETAFDFELKYTLNGGAVKVAVISRLRSDAKNPFKFTVAQDGRSQSITRSQLRSGEAHKWLPRHVFAYYSGPSDRLEEHFREHQLRFYRDLLDGREQPFRPLFFARPVHSQFVLLAFATSGDAGTTKFLKEHLGIVAIDSALFVLQRPSWAKAQRQPKVDRRFWGARGVVATFLERLYVNSLAPLRLQGKTEVRGIERPKATEFLYLFVPDLKSLQRLAPVDGTASGFFKELESTYMSELIQQLRVRVRVRSSDGSLTFRELSEGEQQLLTVVGLLRFTKESESLFLLDEPDTHLNPAWGMRYIEILSQVAEPGSDSQVLMATHDPLVLAGLKRNEVVVMDRNDATGKVEAFRPEADPQGLGVVGILRSAMFGLRTTLDLPTQAKLDRRFDLVAKGDKRTADESDELQALSDELSTAGFANEFRDANYDRFAKAVGRVRFADKPILSRTEISELDEEAHAVVRRLLAEETKE
jgi:predicted ATPase